MTPETDQSRSIVIDHMAKALDYGNGLIVEACDHILARGGRLTIDSRFITIGSNRKFVLCRLCVAEFERNILRNILQSAAEKAMKEKLKEAAA